MLPKHFYPITYTNGCSSAPKNRELGPCWFHYHYQTHFWPSISYTAVTVRGLWSTGLHLVDDWYQARQSGAMIKSTFWITDSKMSTYINIIFIHTLLTGASNAQMYSSVQTIRRIWSRHTKVCSIWIALLPHSYIRLQLWSTNMEGQVVIYGHMCY